MPLEMTLSPSNMHGNAPFKNSEKPPDAVIYGAAMGGARKNCTFDDAKKLEKN
jgi:hypothetical protein